MSQVSDSNVKLKIQKTLINIVDVTQRINRELTIINEMIREDGDLNIAVDAANSALIRVAQERGIKSIDTLLKDDDLDLINPTSVDDITKKLKSIMET